ncbi:TIGR00266 family protein [Heliobacterium chlorum]|uniref:TIGR00266 family protein n=1 Tax=Heliobacterium chlorum TaxID=2698 RepID=A0ABR7T407_HELCL|nr:TIGR00266 family protein [Heliobacterium chlorum]
MRYQVLGTTMQALNIDLEPGEQIYTESGAMTWMSSNVKMDTNFKGGFFKSISRALTGESLTFTFFQAVGGPANIGFTPTVPGKVIPVKLERGYELICQKEAFLCAQESVDLSIFFQRKLGAGFFGGEGFIMEKLSGEGMAFVEIDGEVVEKNLGPGERILVDTSHVAMLESSVKMDIQMVKGFKNVIFGGEGLFLTTLTGPGRVWIQTLTLANLAGKILAHAGATKSDGGAINSLGNLFSD